MTTSSILQQHAAPGLLRTGLLALAAAPLAGCDLIVLNPHGDIARQQADLILVSTGLMLLIIVPVLVLTLLFAWRYRASRRVVSTDNYQPDWDHSTRLELLIWGAPLLIILALGTITWISTHQLDPYRPLSRIDAQRPLPGNVQPLEVQVVALDWKWLFIYPEQGIATVNEVVAPVDRPIRFKLTSSTVMNTFYVPALAGMVYTMPGMQTELNAIINKVGTWEGFSANYSGEGFSKMRFKFRGLSDADFQRWVAQAKQGDAVLDRSAYLALEQPGVAASVQRYAQVDRDLFDAAVNRCVERGKLCMGQMMAIDAAGGGGKGGIASLTRQPWRGGERDVVAGLCTPDWPGTLRTKSELFPLNLSRPEL